MMRTIACAWVLMAALAGAGVAQGLGDPGFESQALGTTFAAPWTEGSGLSSQIANFPPVGAGFPTEGSQFAVIDPTGTGPYLGACPVIPGSTMAWISQTFGQCTNVGIISVDWNFINAEGPNQSSYNDFMDISVFSAQNGMLVANLVYVDTRDGSGAANSTPACTPAGGLAYPISFIGGELQPSGPKTSLADLSLVPGYTPGTVLQLVVTVGNRGDSAVASRGYVDNFQVQATPLPGLGQSNSAAARLEVNGAGAGTCQGPFSILISSGGSITFAWAGPAGMPVILCAGPQNPGNSNFGCVGTVDIGTPPLFGDISVIFSGTIPGFPNSLFVLNGAGVAQQSFTVPAMASGPVINVQGIVLQPAGSLCPVVLTAGFYISA